jgi:hypothetical protein
MFNQPKHLILKKQSQEIINIVEHRTKPVFSFFFESQSIFHYDAHSMWKLEEFVPNHVKELIDYQQKRYEKKETKTLIFNEKFKVIQEEQLESDQLLQSMQKKAQREMLLPNKVMVFAYDLESVPNTTDIQERVHEPLQVNTTSLLKEDANPEFVYDYEPMMGEIPFSAQWVPVNTSDDGKFGDLKAELLTHNGDLCNIQNALATFTPQEHLREEVLDFNVPEPEREFAGDYILCDPVTEYGDYKFGKCVDDMLFNMAKYAVDYHGAEDLYVYAHNGHHFDNYLILQYNYRWPVTRLLITDRGVLSATIKVTLPRGTVVRIHLRDTLLHVDGSLDAL